VRAIPLGACEFRYPGSPDRTEGVLKLACTTIPDRARQAPASAPPRAARSRRSRG
jgi:hypothetical protein